MGIAFASDLHLSEITWIKYPELRGDSYHSFGQIVKYCEDNYSDIHSLVLGGDLFDKPLPDCKSVEVLVRGLNRLTKRGLDLYASNGQHDGRTRPRWTDLCDKVIQLDDGSPDVPVQLNGKYKLLGIDNTSAARLEEILSQKPSQPYDILVLHQAMEGVVHSRGWNFKKEWVPDFVKLVLMGDIHKPIDDGIFHYAGSISQRAIDENPQKSFLVVDDDLNVARVPLVTRDFLYFTVVDEESRDEALAAMGEYDRGDKDPIIAKPVVVVRISPEAPDALTKLEEASTELDMFLYPMDLQVVGSDREVKKIEVTTISMESLVDERLDAVDFDSPEERADTRDIVVRLLRAKTPADELTVIKHELGVTVEASG